MDKKENSPSFSPEDLKAIGEIAVGPAKHEVFLNNHYKKVLVGILVTGLGIGLGIAYFSNLESRKEQASSLIVKALSTEQSASSTSTFNTESTQAIISNYAETPSLTVAQLIEALDMLEKGQSEQALTALQTLANSSADITVSSRAAASIANYYMAESQNDKAIAAWKQVAAMSINPYTALALMSLGDIAAQSGDKDAARSYYNSVKTKVETSALINAQDVEMRLMTLDIDAPKAVAPKTTTRSSDFPDVNLEDIPSMDESTEGIPTTDFKL